ncbi:MAG TPA: hypothetical protein VJ735_05875 [Actinomycetes bacterium]|nr:hypothetical protein [Actinomycetes bacterium]
MTAMARRMSPQWAARLAWALWALAMLGLAATAWFDHLLRQASRPDLVQLSGGRGVILVLAATSSVTAGAVLASRRPRHPVGWLLLAYGLVVQSLSTAAEGYARYGLLAQPGSLPAATYLAILASVTFIPGLGCIGFILLLTPTGSLPSPRWRRWAWIAAAVPAAFVVAWLLGMPAVDPESVLHGIPNPFAIAALEGPLRVVAGVTAPLTALTLVVAGWSLVRRFRRARGTERQQLRWLSFAAALALPAVLVLYAGVLTGNLELAGWAVGVFLALLPLAICAAIARYRLYDLDRIISRTLAYGLLTVLLGLGYAAVVLGLGRLLPEGSSLVVAAATLAAAAVFQPLRRRVQALVDRRFNRRRYDAAQTIAAFRAHLRQEIDLDTLTGELLAVVEQTMHPTQTSLWLRQKEAPRAVARPVHG